MLNSLTRLCHLLSMLAGPRLRFASATLAGALAKAAHPRSLALGGVARAGRRR